MYIAAALVIHNCQLFSHSCTAQADMCDLPERCSHTCFVQDRRSIPKTSLFLVLNLVHWHVWKFPSPQEFLYETKVTKAGESAWHARWTRFAHAHLACHALKWRKNVMISLYQLEGRQRKGTEKDKRKRAWWKKWRRVTWLGSYWKKKQHLTFDKNIFFLN